LSKQIRYNRPLSTSYLGKKLTHADGLSRREYPPPETVIDKEALDDEAFISAIDSD